MSDIQFEFDLATLDLKGKRFKEAEEKYINLARTQNSSIAWCGLGVAKFGQILEKQATVDEVFFCFEKAKITTPDQISSIENLALQSSFNVVNNLYSLSIRIYNAGNAANAKQSKALLYGIASGIFTTGNSLYGTLLAAGITANSYENYYNGKATAHECQVQLRSILDIIKEIIEKTNSFIELEKEALLSYNDNIRLTEKSAEEQFKTYAQKKQEADNRKEEGNKRREQRTIEREAAKELQLKEDLLNPDHPFHSIKNSAIKNFEFGNLKEAHSLAVEGLNMFPKDELLINVRINSEKSLKSNIKSGCLKDLSIGIVVMIMIVVITTIYEDPNLAVDDRSVIPSLLVTAIIIFGIVRYFKRRTKFKLPN